MTNTSSEPIIARLKTKAERIAAADPQKVAEIEARLENVRPLAERIDKRALLKAGRLDQFDGPNRRSGKKAH